MANGGFGAGLSQGVQTGSMVINSLRAKRRDALLESQEKRAQHQSDVTFGKPATDDAPATEGTVHRELDMAENAPEQAWNRSLQFKPTKSSMLFTGLVKKIPQTAPTLKPLIERIDAGEIKTRGDLRTELFQMHTTGAMEPMRVSLRESAAAAQEKGENGKAQQLMALYEATSKDGFEDLVDSVMGKPSSLRRTASARGLTGKGGGAVSQGTMQEYVNPKTGQVAEFPSKIGAPKGEGWVRNKSRWSIEVGPDGKTRITQGTSSMTQKSTGKVEEKIMEADAGIERLDRIIETFEPEFATARGKASATLLNIKEVLGGKITPEQKDFLSRQSRNFQSAAEDFNLYIKSITGAQVSAKEAERMKFARANYGKTWFTGDGPTKFLDKARNSRELMAQAKSRYENYKQRGLSDSEIKGLIKSGTATPLPGLSSGVKAKPKGRVTKPAGDISQMTDEQIKQQLGIQ